MSVSDIRRYSEGLGRHILEDFFTYFADEVLGAGMDRKVFSLYNNEKFVIKYEEYPDQNVLEQFIWGAVKDTVHAKWFAPVIGNSPCNHFNIMQRTAPIRADELPERVPSFFTDLKPSSWGMINGRPVCHDYGKILMLEKGMTKRMKKANWGDEQ